MEVQKSVNKEAHKTGSDAMQQTVLLGKYYLI